MAAHRSASPAWHFGRLVRKTRWCIGLPYEVGSCYELTDWLGILAKDQKERGIVYRLGGFRFPSFSTAYQHR
jgi:hypothetical protein